MGFYVSFTPPLSAFSFFYFLRTAAVVFSRLLASVDGLEIIYSLVGRPVSLPHTLDGADFPLDIRASVVSNLLPFALFSPPSE